VFYKFYPKL